MKPIGTNVKEEIEVETRTLEASMGGIRLTCEKIETYFIERPGYGDKEITRNIKLEDIRIIAQLLMAFYNKFKEIEENEKL